MIVMNQTTITYNTYNTYNTLPSAYTLRGLTIAPNTLLAPMAGVTDTVFRRIIRGLGSCGLVCSEMTNAASMSPKALKKHKLLEYQPEERPFAMQISGNDPFLMAEAARKVQALGADILDINCGCPSPKVTGGGHGASLLRDLPRFASVLHAVREASAIPVTVKLRAGWDDQSLNYLETARIAEEAGMDALTLHPRTREQRYTGTADWQRIAAVKAHVTIPVIGNGDIASADDALEKLAWSKVDGIMIGRAALSNPWIFQQIAQVRQNDPPFVPTPTDRYALLQQFIDQYLNEVPERLALNKLKQFISHFIIGLPGCAALRANVHHSRSIAEARMLLEQFFTRYQYHYEQTMCGLWSVGT